MAKKQDLDTLALFADTPAEEEKPVTIASAVVLEGLFIYKNQPHMRVAPAKWMLNSSLIYDNMICRGNIMAVNLETRQVAFIDENDITDKINNKRMTYIKKD